MSKAGKWWRDYEQECREWERQDIIYSYTLHCTDGINVRLRTYRWGRGPTATIAVDERFKAQP